MLHQKIQSPIISIVLFFAVACGSEVFGRSLTASDTITVQTATSSKPAVKNLRQLITRLKVGGERVAGKGKVEQPFFSVKGQIIILGDQELQVFEYRTAKQLHSSQKRLEAQVRPLAQACPCGSRHRISSKAAD